MCGIVGICYGPHGPEGEDWSPTELAQIMFPSVVHRGPHAFGWMSWSEKDEHIDIVKLQGRADDKANLAEVEINPSARWWVGHVRFATHGSPSVMANNHPIAHGDIVGVHNGILRNYASILAETGREDEAAQVDSEAIFAAVNKHGIRAGLRRVEGDMVSVFAHVERPATLNIARSYGRPLHYATTKAGSLIFASEPGIIKGTGMETGTLVDLHGRYQILKVRHGRVKERIQYRTETHKKWTSTPSGYTTVKPVQRQAAKTGVPAPSKMEKKWSELTGQELELQLFGTIPGYVYDDEEGAWVLDE